jgi:hypothetical protein
VLTTPEPGALDASGERPSPTRADVPAEKDERLGTRKGDGDGDEQQSPTTRDLRRLGSRGSGSGSEQQS